MRFRSPNSCGRLLVGGMAAVLVAACASTASAATITKSPAEPAQGSVAGETKMVTLLTGDRILVGPGNAGRVLPGKGREKIGFSSFETRGHKYVIPNDASPLVAKGTLDIRLFDVTGLIADGYDDASRTTLPLIMTYRDAAAPRALSQTAGTKVTQVLPSIGGAAVSSEKTPALWNNLTTQDNSFRALDAGVEKVWLDGKRQADLDHSVPQIGAPTAWEAGFTGEGTKVAVLDTGVDQTHPDLADRELTEKNFSGAADSVDHFGHGTHVASIVAGTGAKSGGKYKGVAPGARILDGKVLDDYGSGQESWIIAGMQWAAEQGADVANLSLGGGDTPEIDPLEEAVNTLSAQYPTLFVIAAGNSGPGKGSVGSPGTADAALTVGAVDRDDKIAPFSSRGPRVGDGGIKPDITAPGVGIVAALHSDGKIGPPVVDGYTALSGTSMATPHVAGAAALLAQQHPDLTGQQLKALLTASAKPSAGLTVFDQGSGRVDSAAVLGQTVVSTPTSLTFGVQQWPHDDDQAVTKEIAYTNSGDAPVTLDLRVEAAGPDGKPAPAGVFTVSPAQVTVPPGGKATATASGDARAVTQDGVYSGTVIATGGKTSVRTPVAIDREVESYDLTLNTIGRDGAAPTAYYTTLINVDSVDFFRPYDVDGSVTVRAPKGRYLLQTTVLTATTTDILNYPNLTVGGDLTVDLDARLAKPVKVSAPDKTAALGLAEISFTRTVGDQSYGIGTVFFDSIEGAATAHLGPELPPAELSGLVNTQWTAGTSAYGLAWYTHGKLVTGFVKDVKQSDVAAVNVEFGPLPTGLRALTGANPSPHLRTGGSWGLLSERSVPGTHVEYYNGDDVDWSRIALFEDPAMRQLRGIAASPPKYYSPQRTYRESVLRAVFGPVVPVSYYPGDGISRLKDRISVYAALVGDSGGNTVSTDTDKGNTRLYRNGKAVGQSEYPGSGAFDVEPGDAAYLLTSELTRTGYDLSSRVSVAWTFRSNTTTASKRLPISTIRYFPALDNAESAPSGVPFTVPVAVQEQGTDVLKTPYRLTAEASYDGGLTWTPATVLGNAQLVLHHQAGAETVSLRAKATDGNGNTVEQTIVNAYRLR